MRITNSYVIKIKHYNHIFRNTLKVYNDAVGFFINVAIREWSSLPTKAKEAMSYIEHLSHKTKDNPFTKYDFDNKFYKMPSYLRRAAIIEAIGMVSSYKSNYANWLVNKNGREPKMPTAKHCFPCMYNSNMFVREDEYSAKIKIYRNNTWDWLDIDLRRSDVNYIKNHCKGEESSPTLLKVGKQWFLRFAYKSNATLSKNESCICAVDLGINNAATVSIMSSNGTILGREFLSLPSETDSLTHALNRIKKVQQYGAKRMPRLWAKADGINKDISDKTSLFIINAALKYNVSTIVFEYLDIQGKKHGSKKQRLHLWKCKEVQAIVERRAHAHGMRISHVNASGTSKYAYDGSGLVIRDKNNYSLCIFSTGKHYNCDLSASYNIGARYYIRNILKSVTATQRLSIEAKVPQCLKRNTCTLSTLIKLNALI